MKRMMKKISRIMLSVFSVVAIGSMSTGSSCFLHQTEEPEILRKKSEE